MHTLRISTPQIEGVLQVAKSLKYQVLLDAQEMCALVAALPSFLIGGVSEPVGFDEGLIPVEKFLNKYAEYVEPLKRGELPEELGLRRYFSSVVTADPDALYAMDVGKGRYLVKAIRPVIQLQLHHFFYSTVDQKFHPAIQGKDSVTWGLQISYPQIAQDPQTKAIQKVESDTPNTQLFAQLARWMREYTRPTPFIVDGKRSNEPIRLGKECFSWIGAHPQLRAKGIQVRGGNG